VSSGNNLLGGSILSGINY
jgi:hypothetical protein